MGSEKLTEQSPGYYFSKKQVIIGVIVVVVLLVGVGLIAGLAGNSCGSHGSQGGTKTPTARMTQATHKPTQAITPNRATTRKMEATTKSQPQSQATTVKVTMKPKPTPFTGSKAVLNSLRLPTNVKPVQYRFSLDINVDGRNYSGSNVAEVQVLTATDILVIHMKDIKLTTAPLLSTDLQFGQLIPISEYNYYAKNEFLYLMVNTPLQPGTYFMKFEYHGNMSTDLFGLFANQYRHLNGDISWMIVSQAAATDARRIMPLHDEPAIKANYTGSITVPSDYFPLFNMPNISNSNLGNGKTIHQFQTSVKMSAYLLAIVVSKYGYIEARTNRGTPVRVYANKEVLQYGHYALQAGVNITNYFEQLMGQPYSLPKLDMVAIDNFPFSAMENWGLVVYLQRVLLFKPAEDTVFYRERIARIVSHELAHMWFGNLVTFHWWSNVWLNEGFATFYEYIGSNQFEPSWQLMDLFVIRELQTGLAIDASKSSHPMEVHYFPSNAYLLSYYSPVEYNKGGSVLRMLKNMIGDAKYDSAIKLYVSRRQWKESNPNDLWKAMEETLGDGTDVTGIANTWIKQMGHPIVTIKRHPTDPNKGIFTQQRYLTNGTLDPNSENPASPHTSPYGYKWTIPMNYYVSANVSRNHYKLIQMKDAETTFDWQQGTWIKANTNEYGFFRVNYPEDNWNQLATAMQHNHNTLSKRDRCNLINDALTFAEAERIKFGTGLGITKYLVNETDFLPWFAANQKLWPVMTRLETRKSFGYFWHYYLRLLDPIVKKLKFEDTGGHLERSLRVSVMGVACHLGDHSCRMNASKLFMKWMMNATENPIPASLRMITYAAGVAKYGPIGFHHLWNVLNNTYRILIRRDIITALAQAQEPWLLTSYLHKSLHSNRISSSEKARIFDEVAATPIGRFLPWEYIKRNFKTLYKVYKGLGSLSSLGRLISNSVRRFDDSMKYMEMEMFFKKHTDFMGYKNTVLTSIHRNIQWLEKHESAIAAWCKAQMKPM